MKVLVVAAHPDDEVLGCGGTMARHAAAGDEVRVLILAEGATSRRAKREPARDRDALAGLGRAAMLAAKRLGIAHTELEKFPDNRMDGVDLLDVVKAIESRVAKFRPEVVYTHHAADLNVDHRVAHQAVLTACRPLPGATVARILCFEVPSSTEWQSPAGGHFAPDWFVDISRTLQAKIKALQAYAGEMRPWPHARSLRAVEHLARWRGASAGLEAAEAFVLARAIERR
jgi:LmbE family N-acetylglucosaminyl deacetylase